MDASLNKKNKVALVTGFAGFIGFFVCKKLLDEGWQVIGVDNLSDYYDVTLKKQRMEILENSRLFKPMIAGIENPGYLKSIFEIEKPNIIIHLAAQAGVRYSIENPRSYLESNIVGTFELLEAARAFPPEHMLFASTSSIYGSNEQLPYCEIDKADHQMSFYAATKKSSENIAHSYAHLYDLPITMFRFFTVYGPWGRPDMALFKFTESIFKGRSIDVYNSGNMKRDFTYIDDLVHAINLLIDIVPSRSDNSEVYINDNISPVAPFRVVNIGNSDVVNLMDFIEAIEEATGIQAKKNMLPMQAGDVYATWANVELLKSLTGYSPNTNIKKGIKSFVDWYKDFYMN
jgi:UDP-glucuronate 4-epimerase